jgi:hypothetical protein
MEPDVLGKIDALLTRHRTGAPAQQDLAMAETQAARAAIPVLTEIITDDNTIPVLTEAVPVAETNETATAGNGESQRHIDISAGDPVANIPHDDAALRQIEEFMVRELENRIALEFAATLDRALNELLDQTREHIRLAVRVALKQRIEDTPSDPPSA